jgi:hypothetical protein
MADPAIAGTIASFAVVAILLPLLVLLLPSLLLRHLLAPLLPGVIFRGDRQRRELAITIVDGPRPGSDGSRHTGSMVLLALLRELQVPATLIVISGHLERADPARPSIRPLPSSRAQRRRASCGCSGSVPAVAGSGPRCSPASGPVRTWLTTCDTAETCHSSSPVPDHPWGLRPC